jgi:hypothetical protein
MQYFRTLIPSPSCSILYVSSLSNQKKSCNWERELLCLAFVQATRGAGYDRSGGGGFFPQSFTF